MSQEPPVRPNSDPSHGEDQPPVDAPFRVVDGIADDAKALQVEATHEIGPEPPASKPPVPPQARSPKVKSQPVRSPQVKPQPQVKSQTLQRFQQVWQTIQPILVSLWNLLRTGGQKFWLWWNRTLPSIRRLLPASLQPLSNNVLTGAIATLLILLIWLISSLFPSQPSTQITTRPFSPSRPAAINRVSTAAPKPAPTPIPIARIQDQVAQISNKYADGLIQSIQANFRGNRLTVNVSDRWYGLSESQQGKLANDLLSRTQELNFDKLELINSEGTLLARSPVVGSEMVVLQRSRPQVKGDGMAG